MKLSVLVLFLAVTLSSTSVLASYTCDQLTVGEVCTYRDGYDMATCERTYCGNEVYNCETCPGLLDGGADLSAPIVAMDNSGCQMTGRQRSGDAALVMTLGLFGVAFARRRTPGWARR